MDFGAAMFFSDYSMGPGELGRAHRVIGKKHRRAEIHHFPPKSAGAGATVPKLGEAHPYRFRPLAALGDVDHHPLAFIEGADARALEH